MASQVSVHCCLAASRPAERKSFVVERKQSCSSVAARKRGRRGRNEG